MDLRDPMFSKDSTADQASRFYGCPDDNVVYRLMSDGTMQKKPPCADCNSKNIECHNCENEGDNCLPHPCVECLFDDICDADKWPDDDGLDVDYIKLHESREGRVLSIMPLSFKLKSYYISKIENGLIIYYKLDNDTDSRKRYFPDTESLCKFIKQHTDKS